MDQIEHLQDQIARAERLARDAFDKLTTERLRAFADECRTQLKTIAERNGNESRLISTVVWC